MGGYLPDNEVIAKSLSDPESFATIFDRHYDGIAAFLRRRLSEHAAEECAAETFLVAFRSRSNFDPERGSARGWLYGVALNLMRHRLREQERGSRAAARFPVDRPVDFAEGAIDRIESSARQADLLEVLERLPEQERNVLVLRAWADLSYAEIATALGVPIGTVRSQLARARRKARELIEAQGAISG